MGSCVSGKKTKQVNARGSMANIGMRMTLLDRFGVNQTKQLLELFEKVSDKEGIDQKGLMALIPTASELPSPVFASAFNLFDIDQRGRISFSNFCVTVSQYLVGHREEKCKFLFKIFDYNHNGILESKELSEFKKYIRKALRQNDITYSHEEVEKTIENWKTLTLPQLISWAFEHLDFHMALKPFEVIPSPTSEKEILKDLLSEKFEFGETWFLISTPWLEAWKNYVNFEIIGFGENVELSPSLGKLRSKSILPGSRPVEINNIEFQDPFCSLHIREDAKSPEMFTVIHPNVWKELQNWYGGGPEFPREIIKNGNDLEIELFPVVLKVHFLSNNVKNFVVSKGKTIKFVLDLIGKEKSRLYLVVGNSLKLLSESGVVGNVFHEKVVKCVYQVIVSDKDLELSEFIEYDDDFDYDRGEEIEYKEDGQWLSGYIKEIKVDEAVIGANWRLKIVTIPKSESFRIRKPSRALITTSRSLKATGLVNLGNTCYMNAIIQCLNNTPLLSPFFINGTFMRHINSQILQVTKGIITRNIGNLLRNLSTGLHLKVRPYEFFNSFSEAFSYFQGNDQQDAHEFLRILLDSLHDDLNRHDDHNVNKTITLHDPNYDDEMASSKEHWEKIQGSIGSVISDLFGGQTRNKITCKSCPANIVIFELLMDISLPIPILPPNHVVEIIFIPHLFICCTKFRFHFNRNFLARDLTQKVFEEIGLDRESLVFAVSEKKLMVEVQLENLLEFVDAEIYVFEKLKNIEEVEVSGKKTLKKERNTMWREELATRDLVDIESNGTWNVGHVLRLGKGSMHVMVESENSEIIKVSHESARIAQHRTYTSHNSKILHFFVYHCRIVSSISEFFGLPQLLSIGNWYTFKELRQILESICAHLSLSSKILGFFKFAVLTPTLQCSLCKTPNCKGCEIPNNFKYLDSIHENSIITVLWENFIMYKPKLKEIEEIEDISIYKCLQEFGKEEKIDFNCEKCGGKTGVTKTDICRLPDILIVHLKRFRFEETQPVKVNNKIVFPLVGLDLASVLSETRSPSKKNEFAQSNSKENYLYDLFAVVNHSGNVLGGHYTCSCIGEIFEEKKWLYYDDDKVYELQGDPVSEIVTSNAYILLYKRQRLSSSNVINLYG